MTKLICPYCKYDHTEMPVGADDTYYCIECENWFHKYASKEDHCDNWYKKVEDLLSEAVVLLKDNIGQNKIEYDKGYAQGRFDGLAFYEGEKK